MGMKSFGICSNFTESSSCSFTGYWVWWGVSTILWDWELVAAAGPHCWNHSDLYLGWLLLLLYQKVNSFPSSHITGPYSQGNSPIFGQLVVCLGQITDSLCWSEEKVLVFPSSCLSIIQSIVTNIILSNFPWDIGKILEVEFSKDIIGKPLQNQINIMVQLMENIKYRKEFLENV